jgi:hypothetical protein
MMNGTGSMLHILKWAVGALAFGFLLTADPAVYVSRGSWMSEAEAVVGRPATPVSAAGVARRTTRRCVAGVPPC